MPETTSAPVAGPMALLPRFTQPGRLRNDPDPAQPDPATPDNQAPPAAGPELPPPPGDAGALPDPLPPMTEHAATRTATSTRSDRADPRVAAEMAGVLVVLVVAGFAFLVTLRSSGEHALRRPTPDQRRRIADPLGRILARHVPAEALTGDVVDLVAAGAATGDYLSDGPLVVAAPVDAGDMPDPALLEGAQP